MADEVTPEARQEFLLELLLRRGQLGLTISEAWSMGYSRGLYEGGDAPTVKDDLNALVQRQKAKRHDGFWRHMGQRDHRQMQNIRWADYWTAR